MTTTDPLAGLFDLPWADLEHAYGSAEDVPYAIQALTSATEEDREKAIWHLYSNIFHQGTRYEATAPAVPFLARLACDPGTPGRAQIIDLLGSITVGFDEAYLPGNVEPGAQRAEFERLLDGGAERMREFEAWIAAAADDSERERRKWRRDIYNHEHEVQASRSHLDAYAAVRAQIPALSTLLDEEDAVIRASVAYVMAWFPEDAADSLPGLAALLERETDSRVIATAIIATGLLGGPEQVPAVQPKLASGDPLIKWAAAIALARLGERGPEVVGALADAVANPPETGDQEGGGPAVRFLDGDSRGYASISLIPLADALTPETFDAVLAGLAGSQDMASFAITGVALRLAFPEGPAEVLPPFAELDERRQRVVRVLADMSATTWHWGNFTDIVRAWRLPHSHAGLREYAGMPPID